MNLNNIQSSQTYISKKANNNLNHIHKPHLSEVFIIINRLIFNLLKKIFI